MKKDVKYFKNLARTIFGDIGASFITFPLAVILILFISFMMFNGDRSFTVDELDFHGWIVAFYVFNVLAFLVSSIESIKDFHNYYPKDNSYCADSFEEFKFRRSRSMPANVDITRLHNIIKDISSVKSYTFTTKKDGKFMIYQNEINYLFNVWKCNLEINSNDNHNTVILEFSESIENSNILRQINRLKLINLNKSVEENNNVTQN